MKLRLTSFFRSLAFVFPAVLTIVVSVVLFTIAGVLISQEKTSVENEIQRNMEQKLSLTKVALEEAVVEKKRSGDRSFSGITAE